MRHTVLYFTSAAALFASGLAENVFLIAPDTSATGTPVAVVWIVGESYNASQYISMAQEFQAQAAKDGLAAWIGIPDFTFSTPNPLEVKTHINDAVTFLKSAGFSGNSWFLAAHSLGGVMTQKYLTSNTNNFLGQILMSSVLLRDNHSI